MLCSKCRHMVPDDSKTCSYCGATMPVQSSPRRIQKVNPTPSTSYSKRTQEEITNIEYRYNRQINALYENPSNTTEKARGAADASLILGVIGIGCWFSGYGSIVSVIVGALGLRMASKAKRDGYDGGERILGAALSCFSLVGGLIVLLFVCGLFLTLFSAA